MTIYKENSPNSERVAEYLKMGLLYFMSMPMLTLCAWSILVCYSNYQDKLPIWSGLCILFLGLAFLLAGYNIMRVKWSNYRFKVRNMVYLAAVFVLVTLYQVMVVFGYEHKEKFLPYSAIFLNINVTILAVTIFLSKYKE